MSEPNKPDTDVGTSEHVPTNVSTRKHARPGSKWNSSNRHAQKRTPEPKGFARGARVK